jgi:hypothetical protein
VYRRPGRSTWGIIITTPGGEVRKSSGTRDKATARAIERALNDLKTRRDWQVLNAVIDGVVSPGVVFDAVRTGGLDQLRAVSMTYISSPRSTSGLSVTVSASLRTPLRTTVMWCALLFPPGSLSHDRDSRSTCSTAGLPRIRQGGARGERRTPR